MARVPTVKVKANTKSGFKTINKSDYDSKSHELFEEKSNSKEVEKEYKFGDFEAKETGSKGWWKVVNSEGERQNEKNLREDDAIALAKELGG